jgi:hypothetical protein
VSAEEYRIRRRGSLVLANETVYDRNLSYTALGVLAVLLARPDDAPKGYRTLMRPEAGVGQASILSAFRELREHGYRYQFYRTETKARRGNRVYTCTYIYELPVSLEMAKRDHFNETGCEPIEVQDRRKSKGTLASVPDAHVPDAQEPDAHDPDAQRTSSASLGFSPSIEEINQGDAPENDDKAKEPPPQPGPSPGDAATTPFGISPRQAEINSKGAALARAALRGNDAAAS